MNGSSSTMKIVVVSIVVFVILYFLFNTDITKKTRGDKTKIEIKSHVDADFDGNSDVNEGTVDSSAFADEEDASLLDVDGVEVERTEQVQS